VGDAPLVSPRHDPVAFVDERLEAAAPLRKALRYVFPEHWSFLLGEMALYAFAVLVATGVFLALFFDPSTAQMTWHGPYPPLDGAQVSRAYGSALDLSLTVPGGLLMRQTHHWAALLFVVAITLHLLRVAFTAAFRRPRGLTYAVGVTLLMLAVVEGYAGYSLLDDLLSGMGLAIGYSTALSIPGVGGALGALIWDGPFPGGPAFESRLFIAHVFVLPAAIATLIGAHLLLVVRTRHAQFPGPGRREGNVVGAPLGWLLAVAAVLVLLGGLVQINPVWQWGPYEPWLGENGAQPDWYLGWLIGALRLMPHWEIHAFGRTIVPNPFFGGVAFPGAVFGFLYALPALDRLLLTRDRAEHHLLDRARDSPRRTAVLAAVLALVATVFFFGSADRIFLSVSIPYELQLWVFRGLLLAGPVVVYSATRRWCLALARGDAHPMRGTDAVLAPPPPIEGSAPGVVGYAEAVSELPQGGDR
jgi:ubiquinol-cytochrome c reductase cytochrome b subunit